MDKTELELKRLNKRVTVLEEDYQVDDRTNTISQQTFNKFADFRDALKIPSRSATPATCRIGQLVEVAGTFYGCTAADMWTAFGSGGSKYIILRVIAPGTSQTVTTTVGGDFESPISGTISAIGAWVDTAGTTGTATIDVNIGGTTIMTTNKITLDTTEKTSRTAATAPALTTTSLAIGDIITVDIDVIQTTPAKGLTVRLQID